MINWILVNFQTKSLSRFQLWCLWSWNANWLSELHFLNPLQCLTMNLKIEWTIFEYNQNRKLFSVYRTNLTTVTYIIGNLRNQMLNYCWKYSFQIESSIIKISHRWMINNIQVSIYLLKMVEFLLFFQNILAETRFFAFF